MIQMKIKISILHIWISLPNTFNPIQNGGKTKYENDSQNYSGYLKKEILKREEIILRIPWTTQGHSQKKISIIKIFFREPLRKWTHRLQSPYTTPHKTQKSKSTRLAAYLSSLKAACTLEGTGTPFSFWPAAKHHKENGPGQKMHSIT